MRSERKGKSWEGVERRGQERRKERKRDKIRSDSHFNEERVRNCLDSLKALHKLLSAESQTHPLILDGE